MIVGGFYIRLYVMCFEADRPYSAAQRQCWCETGCHGN